MIPSIGFALLFFYAFDNPLTGATSEKDRASYSWWFIFLGVRQPIALCLALATQALVIDFALFRTRTLMKYCGSFGTLFFVQARGYPFLAVAWGLWNFLLNWGPHRFASNWLYWQHTIKIFSDANPR
jgi:hypothetical protein